MAYKKVKRIYDKETLSKRADEIAMLKDEKTFKKANSIIGRLKDILRTNEDMIALSAPQIGYPFRIFCVKFSDGDIRGFINPLIYKTSNNTYLSREIKLGFDSNVEYLSPRYESVEMSFQTPVGNVEANKFDGVVGAIVQQMVNLLDGVLLDDYALELMIGFDEMKEEDKKEVINLYIEALEKKNELLKQVIEEDKKHVKVNEAIEFMEQAKLGNIEFAKEEDKKQ